MTPRGPIRRKALLSAVRGFMGTFVSRYTEHGGYWLFGFLVGRDGPLVLDLLDSRHRSASGTPEADAAACAVHRFADQLCKARIDRAIVRTARLTIETLPGLDPGCAGTVRAMLPMRVTVQVLRDDGVELRETVPLAVWPHDPGCERRSARSD